MQDRFEEHFRDRFQPEFICRTFKEKFDNSNAATHSGMIVQQVYEELTEALTKKHLYPIKISDPDTIVMEKSTDGSNSADKGIIYISCIAMPMADYPMFNGNMENFDKFREVE